MLMIESDLIKWIIEVLKNEKDSLSEYSYEYATALFMNLSLRTEGKKKCEELEVLRILFTDLLGSRVLTTLLNFVAGGPGDADRHFGAREHPGPDLCQWIPLLAVDKTKAQGTSQGARPVGHALTAGSEPR